MLSRKLLLLLVLMIALLPISAVHVSAYPHKDVGYPKQALHPVTAGPYMNDCHGWADMLGKETKVHDSRVMHALGCDDSGGLHGANAHYHATVNHNRNDFCTKRARFYARWGYFQYPQSIMQWVVEDLPFCHAFVQDDWTYEALT